METDHVVVLSLHVEQAVDNIKSKYDGNIFAAFYCIRTSIFLLLAKPEQIWTARGGQYKHDHLLRVHMCELLQLESIIKLFPQHTKFDVLKRINAQIDAMQDEEVARSTVPVRISDRKLDLDVLFRDSREGRYSHSVGDEDGIVRIDWATLDSERSNIQLTIPPLPARRVVEEYPVEHHDHDVIRMDWASNFQGAQDVQLVHPMGRTSTVIQAPTYRDFEIEPRELTPELSYDHLAEHLDQLVGDIEDGLSGSSMGDDDGILRIDWASIPALHPAIITKAPTIQETGIRLIQQEWQDSRPIEIQDTPAIEQISAPGQDDSDDISPAPAPLQDHRDITPPGPPSPAIGAEVLQQRIERVDSGIAFNSGSSSLRSLLRLPIDKAADAVRGWKRRSSETWRKISNHTKVFEDR